MQPKPNLPKPGIISIELKYCAPFEGRILKTMAGVGQRVGEEHLRLLRIYALDSAEIDLSLSRSEMRFLGFSEQLGIPGQSR